MYARTDNMVSKSDEDLKALKEAGVDDLYIEHVKEDAIRRTSRVGTL